MKKSHRQNLSSKTHALPEIIAKKQRADDEHAVPNEADLLKMRRDAEAKSLALFPEHEPRLVAEVASRLLGSGNDFAGATKRALSLLDACESAAKKRREWRDANTIGQMRDRDVPAHLTFQKGVKFITGQPRVDRAAEAFKKFLSYHYGESSNPKKGELHKSTKRKLAAEIERYEREGFERHLLALGKRDFQTWSKLQKKAKNNL